MASPQPEFTAHEIMAFSDKELDDYLAECLGANAWRFPFGAVLADNLHCQTEGFKRNFRQRIE